MIWSTAILAAVNLLKLPADAKQAILGREKGEQQK
jgi:hypothetical protein